MSKRNRPFKAARLYLGALALLAAAVLVWYANTEPKGISPDRSIGLHSVLGTGGVAPGFQKADRPREFRFPADHGSHDGFRSEWWYFTGNLQASNGAQFGYQLTLFRNALGPAMLADHSSEESAWRTRQIYMGHFALTDVANQAHFASERFAREALGLAGSRRDPLRVWVDDWSVELVNGVWQLAAASNNHSIRLVLEALKPPVLQGDDGLSVKSEGNASYYYSLTRMQTEGQLSIADNDYQVTGLSWLDREWSTSSLSSQQSGWDWLSLQFDNGWELMFYQLRQTDGSPDPHSTGVLVDRAGKSKPLPLSQLEMTPARYWESPQGVRYPVAWHVKSPAHELALFVDARVDAQEMPLAFRYWEGAVNVSGTLRGLPVAGSGFLELTGYGLGGGPQSGQ